MSEAEKNLTSGPGAGLGQKQINPGDEARPGTPGTGENVCRHCGGSGRHGTEPCPVCGGTGKVVEGIGGG